MSSTAVGVGSRTSFSVILTFHPEAAYRKLSTTHSCWLAADAGCEGEGLVAGGEALRTYGATRRVWTPYLAAARSSRSG